jgi:DNA polymerase-4
MVGKSNYRLLRSMGVSNIQTLRMIPPDMMLKLMGKNGMVLWKKANGIDNTPVVQYSERKSISTERTFDKDTTDIVKLKSILISMVERVAFDMRKKHKLTGCISVKIRYSNFDTHSLQKNIPYTSFDHILQNIALELFDKIYSRRMLIRLIGVRFSKLVGGHQQLNMFEDSHEMINLYEAMDNIRLRYGKNAIKKAVGL